jgi:putative MFS transporter
MALQSTDVG